MHLYRNICQSSVIFYVLVLLAGVTSADNASIKRLNFQWNFPPETTLSYSLTQNAQTQQFRHESERENPQKSPIQKEVTSGTATLKTLPDGNAYGDLILHLEEIRQKDKSMRLPEKQKIPQKVCKFIMRENGEMEQYSGPKKETYVLTRLIFGLPIKPLKLSEVQVYPFQLFTDGDESDSAMNGQISHEFQKTVQYNNETCALIVTTISLVDENPGSSIQKSIWKGTGETLFNIEKKRMEKSLWQLALKKQLNPRKADDPTLMVEIFDILTVLNSTKRKE